MKYPTSQCVSSQWYKKSCKNPILTQRSHSYWFAILPQWPDSLISPWYHIILINYINLYCHTTHFIISQDPNRSQIFKKNISRGFYQMLCIYVRHKIMYIGQYMYLLSDFLSRKYRHWPQKASKSGSFINCHILIFGLLPTSRRKAWLKYRLFTDVTSYHNLPIKVLLPPTAFANVNEPTLLYG